MSNSPEHPSMLVTLGSIQLGWEDAESVQGRQFLHLISLLEIDATNGAYHVWRARTYYAARWDCGQRSLLVKLRASGRIESHPGWRIGVQAQRSWRMP